VSTVGVELFVQMFIHMWPVTINTFISQIRNSKLIRHLLALYVINADFLYTSKNTPSNPTVSF
jgi:hypothetical protein